MSTLPEPTHRTAKHIIWTHIISLKREDAARLGFDHADAWKNLLMEQRNTIAEAMKIPPHELCWYAAFHNTTHHPHVHMMVYSADPKKGFLTREGIKQIRSSLTNSIFRDEMYVLYEQKSQQRDALVAQARQSLSELIAVMQSGEITSPSIESKLLALSEKLRHTGGKKIYGYLKAPVKLMVDEIVDELASASSVREAYAKWQELQADVTMAYQSTPPVKLPLSQQPEFKAIKNAVIREAMLLSDDGVILHDESPDKKMDMALEEGGAVLEMQERTVLPPKAAPAVRRPDTALAVTRLLHQLSNIFRENSHLAAPSGLRIDRKRRRVLQQKKKALGHAQNDYEQTM